MHTMRVIFQAQFMSTLITISLESKPARMVDTPSPPLKIGQKRKHV